jgi:hypothetical protein
MIGVWRRSVWASAAATWRVADCSLVVMRAMGAGALQSPSRSERHFLGGIVTFVGSRN